MTTGLADRVAAIRAEVDALGQVAPRDLDGAAAIEFFDGLFELSDRLHALAVRVLPVVESDGLWAIGGARTFPTWLARRARITHGRAKRMTGLGRALREELTLTSAAVVAGGEGRVGVEQAEILTTVAATSPTRRQVLADSGHVCGERFLLEQARMLSADALRTLARRWAAAADPEADDRGYRDATEREFFDVAHTTGGCHLSGFLTTEHGQALLVALDAVTGKPAKDDDRTYAQRRAGALTDLARTALDHGLVGAGSAVRPHLNVLIDWATLVGLATAAGMDGQLPVPTGAGGLSPAVFEDGQPVPRAVLERLMCDGELSRTIFGPDSQVINIGRTKRLYPRALRRAIIARDKHCQYPTCNAPPRLCEGHHTKHWVRDHGDTDATTGILLCWHHHTYIHDNGIGIAWKTGGGWQFTDPLGYPLHTD